MKSFRHRHLSAALSACAGLAITLAAASPAFATAAVEKSYTVKLRINIYRMAGVTQQQVKDAVAKANEILKQAMVRLELAQVCINKDIPQPGGDDGSLTRAERDSVRQSGGLELSEPFGNGKGVKAAFVRQPHAEDADTAGSAIEGDPTIIVQNRPTTAKTGENMAHEFGHVFGLRDIYDPPERKDSLMWGYEDTTDTKLSQTEIDTIKENAKEFGVESTKKKGASGAAPATKTSEAHGAKTNPSSGGDLSFSGPTRGGADYQNVYLARINSLEDDTNFNVNLELDGFFPPALTATTNYLLLFNTDNDAMTGSPLHGRSGVDKVVRAEVNGAAIVNYFLENPDGSGSVPLTGDTFRGLECYFDTSLMEPDIPVFDPANDFLRIQVPRSALDFVGGDLYNVGIVTTDADLGVTDSFDMIFDLAFHTRGPQLGADRGTYEPGQLIQLSGSGFDPLESIDFRIDDLPMGNFNADINGDFFMSFAAPTLPGDFYFLTAEGIASGNLATTVANIPTPGALMLSIVGIGLAAARRRPR